MTYKKTKKEEQLTKEMIIQKADELLAGITPSIDSITTKKDQNLIIENETDGGIEWLEGEINRQAEQIIKLKEEIIQHKTENENLKTALNNKPTIDPNLGLLVKNMRDAIYRIYNDLSIHSTQFDSANIKILMGKFKKEFDFLNR